MPYRESHEYDVLDDRTPVALASSTDATPVVVTTGSAHGLSTGDAVLIYGHTTNVAVNGIFRVTVVTATTFSLQQINGGANVAGSGAGAGGADGHMIFAPKILSCEDFSHITLQINTADSAALTIKFAGSNGKLSADADGHGDTPNFGATVADDNPYNFIDHVELDGGGAIVDGDIGLVLAADKDTIIELNVNGLKYVCPIVTAFTQGKITMKAKLFNNA